MLYQDAKARRSNNSRSRYLDALMRVPENRYKPELLVEQAELAIVNVDYDVALSSAQLAERHWARLPSDLVFTRKAMIYEIQAAAHTGKFYASDGAELDELEHAIRDWERYRQHVGTKHRADLEQRADERLAQLYDMQQRLE
jgi:hypothetical protein